MLRHIMKKQPILCCRKAWSKATKRKSMSIGIWSAIFEYFRPIYYSFTRNNMQGNYHYDRVFGYLHLSLHIYRGYHANTLLVAKISWYQYACLRSLNVIRRVLRCVGWGRFLPRTIHVECVAFSTGILRWTHMIKQIPLISQKFIDYFGQKC